jgi:hypothetical protein
VAPRVLRPPKGFTYGWQLLLELVLVFNLQGILWNSSLKVGYGSKLAGANHNEIGCYLKGVSSQVKADADSIPFYLEKGSNLRRTRLNKKGGNLPNRMNLSLLRTWFGLGLTQSGLTDLTWVVLRPVKGASPTGPRR